MRRVQSASRSVAVLIGLNRLTQGRLYMAAIRECLKDSRSERRAIENGCQFLSSTPTHALQRATRRATLRPQGGKETCPASMFSTGRLRLQESLVAGAACGKWDF